MEPNFVTIESAVSELMGYSSPDDPRVGEFEVFRDKLLNTPMMAILLQAVKNKLYSAGTEDRLLTVLVNSIAMTMLAGWNAGCAATEGMKLEELVGNFDIPR